MLSSAKLWRETPKPLKGILAPVELLQGSHGEPECAGAGAAHMATIKPLP